jgi:lysophospholipase L1-like esterase
MKKTALTFFSLLLLAFVCDNRRVNAQEAQKAFDLPSSDEKIPGVGPVRRYDWFINLWKKKHAEWAPRVAQDKGKVVFLGDSITQGWGEDFKNMLPGIRAANRGISGDTTRGMLYRLADDVIKLEPQAVVMLMGTNDLEEKAEPEMVRDNVKLILEELKKHNAKMPIVVCKVFPSSASKARPAEKIKRINALLAELVSSNSQVTVVDTWELFADEKGDARAVEFPDLLHPNDAGYAKWAQALRPVLSKLGLEQLLKPTNSLDSWRLEEHVDGKGTIKVDGENIVFETTKLGSENWHIQAYQLGLDLKDGVTYELSFRASSPQSRRVSVTAGIDEEDWHSIGLFEEVNLDKQHQEYKFTFTANDVKPKNNRLGFVLGDETGTVIVSEIKLRKVD